MTDVINQNVAEMIRKKAQHKRLTCTSNISTGSVNYIWCHINECWT